MGVTLTEYQICQQGLEPGWMMLRIKTWEEGHRLRMKGNGVVPKCIKGAIQVSSRG
jgi:hypothetical protein